MNEETLREFAKEIKAIQNKYGIFISSSYEEEIDYDWEENPYISGCQSFVTFVDAEGYEVEFDENLFRDMLKVE